MSHRNPLNPKEWHKLFALSPDLAKSMLLPDGESEHQPHWLRTGPIGDRKVNRKKKAKDRKHRRDVKRRKRAQR